MSTIYGTLGGEAKKRLPKGIFEYIDRGAEDEIALHNNRAAFDKFKFVNRVLIDVSKRKLNYEFLGKPIFNALWDFSNRNGWLGPLWR